MWSKNVTKRVSGNVNWIVPRVLQYLQIVWFKRTVYWINFTAPFYDKYHTGTALTIQIFQLDTNDDGISLDEKN